MSKNAFEFSSFFRVVLIPLAVGVIAGYGFYNYFEGTSTGNILFAGCTILGLLLGIIRAVRVSQKKEKQ